MQTEVTRLHSSYQAGNNQKTENLLWVKASSRISSRNAIGTLPMGGNLAISVKILNAHIFIKNSIFKNMSHGYFVHMKNDIETKILLLKGFDWQ